MNKHILPILSLAAGTFAWPVWAQQEDRPSPPLVGKIPSGHSVVVEVSQLTRPLELSGKGLEIRRKFHPVLQKIELFKDSTGQLEIRRTYESGSTRSFFIGDAYVEELLPLFPGRYQVSMPDSVGTPMPKFDQTDFPDLAWIEDRHFEGTIRERGRELWHFREIPEQNVTGESGVGREAWIDAQTKLPFRWSDEGRLYQFESMSAWSGSVVLPERARVVLGR